MVSFRVLRQFDDEDLEPGTRPAGTPGECLPTPGSFAHGLMKWLGGLSGLHERGINGIVKRALELFPSACHILVSPAATRQENRRFQGWIVER
jgi:hypothetical protein